MTIDVAVPAPEATADKAHGESHTTASFAALTVGSIGVVYGDIGTSPLYALREAVMAASAGGAVTRAAVLGSRLPDPLGIDDRGHPEICCDPAARR